MKDLAIAIVMTLLTIAFCLMLTGWPKYLP
jgi:hypothetical protein